MTNPTIPMTHIGRTSLLIPRIGSGAAPLAAGTSYKAGVQANTVISAVISQGIWWFDPAPYYGGGLKHGAVRRNFRIE